MGTSRDYLGKSPQGSDFDQQGFFCDSNLKPHIRPSRPWPGVESQREVVDAMVRAIIENGILTVKFISSREDTLVQ